MYSLVEQGQTWLEHLTYQMTTMKYAEQSQRLAGPMALLKYKLSKSAWDISEMATQLFGGRGITTGGMGLYIEQHKRTTKFDSILGGSEEGEFLLCEAIASVEADRITVLADLGVRQASKQMPKAVL